MPVRPLRIATTKQLYPAVEAAGYQAIMIPEPTIPDFNRSLEARVNDGPRFRKFFEKNGIELLLDYNTGAMTFVESPHVPGQFSLTTAALGIPYVSLYLDPITSTMAQVPWDKHWHVLENPTWVKGIWESTHAEELTRMGLPNVLTMPIGAPDDTYDTEPLPAPTGRSIVAFIGHPATTWFKSEQPFAPRSAFAGMLAAAAQSELPDVPFHKLYFDLYELGEPPSPQDPDDIRAQKARDYYGQKFFFNAFLAIKQRDRWVRFLHRKLGDAFSLIGDYWSSVYDIPHEPRIWDRHEMYRRMREIPICLNLMKGNLESGLNLRHFEITAAGGFLLTYPTPELGNFFRIGEECEVFHNEQDLLEKIAFYVEHPERRREIAAAGQRRTLNEHLTSHRVQTVVEILRRAQAVPEEMHVPEGAGLHTGCEALGTSI
jgi:hypothetical protein